jgi:uncharacterized repeat protein (TIGR03803 family)
MSKLSLWRTICLACVFCTVEVIGSPAQTFKTLLSFNGTDGAGPATVLVQGTDGNFYGTTGGGGANSAGTVFKTTPGGTLTTLYNFCAQTNCTDGYAPAGLVLAPNGNFYGTTEWGGTGDNANCTGNGQIGCGTVFEITAAGNFITLHSFAGSEGSAPNGLVRATSGNFYGTTSQGGAHSAGTVFKTTPGGTLTTLYNFCSQPNCTDGGGPSGTQTLATLMQATDGNFYGTTWAGGANGVGTVFKITTGGTLTTLHSFGNGTDGAYPNSGVVQATDGNFYGTTSRGDTIFKMTPGGVLTTLTSDCCYLYAGLIQATDGNLYGTTYFGGAAPPNCPTFVGNLPCGSVFKITLKGALTTLYSFCPQTPCTDGAAPLAGLVQATNGNFYGTTSAGGANNDGTVFSLSVGLGPFVETLPTSGMVGTAVIILGNNLTGATSVTFNGTPAKFTVVSSSTEIKTTVPSGATTGKVKVTTPSGTLTSNQTFRVTPQIKSFSPSSGPVTTPVVITGVSLTQTTKVTFGGKAGAFTVNSDTQVTATVPAGAKTGRITITTPGGTATSATSFTVTP